MPERVGSCGGLTDDLEPERRRPVEPFDAVRGLSGRKLIARQAQAVLDDRCLSPAQGHHSTESSGSCSPAGVGLLGQGEPGVELHLGFVPVP